MNKIPINEIVVIDIAGARARVLARGADHSTLMRRIGFESVGDQFEREVSDMDDRAELVKNLIALGAVFMGGHDWSPSEVVDYLRVEGKVVTGYRKIIWLNPNDYSILDEQPE